MPTQIILRQWNLIKCDGIIKPHNKPFMQQKIEILIVGSVLLLNIIIGSSSCEFFRKIIHKKLCKYIQKDWIIEKCRAINETILCLSIQCIEYVSNKHFLCTQVESTPQTFILINRRLSSENCNGRWRQLLCSFHNYSRRSFASPAVRPSF